MILGIQEIHSVQMSGLAQMSISLMDAYMTVSTVTPRWRRRGIKEKLLQLGVMR